MAQYAKSLVAAAIHRAERFRHLAERLFDRVSTENSNSNILMMEPAQNRNRHDIADRLLASEQWCVFAQG